LPFSEESNRDEDTPFFDITSHSVCQRSSSRLHRRFGAASVQRIAPSSYCQARLCASGDNGKFRGGTSWTLANGIHARLGSTLLHNFNFIGWQRLRVPAGISVEAAIAKYKTQANVEAVEPNYVWKPLKTANDPRFGQQYALSKIKAPAAWDSTTGNVGIVVAVIDSGVDYTHPDLSANMWRNPGEIAANGRDDDNNGYVDDVYGIDTENSDTNPMDDDDHGTHCAGVIGAASNNGVGMTGINWSVQIMALKFLGPNGGSTAGAIKCFEYVTMMKKRGVDIRVTSNSWGGADYSAALKTAMDTAGNAGVIHMTASGNDGLDTDSNNSYPSNFSSAKRCVSGCVRFAGQSALLVEFWSHDC
jgi:subtilisin family serine protease